MSLAAPLRRSPFPLLVALALASVSFAASPEEILRKSDIAAAAPASFRMKLAVTAGEAPHRGTTEIEVYGGPDGKTLVRFLDPKEAGKFLLRRDGSMWFLSPSAKPVKLAPAWRLRGGASLDELLGLRLSRDYDIAGSGEEKESGRVLDRIDLVAKSKGVAWPKVRWFVDRASALPVRSEYRLPSGKVASVVEFREWSDPKRLHLRKMTLRDPLHPGAPTEVEIREVQEKSFPPAIFEIDDGGERKKLAAR
jgi:negative regulator of sigma E activity